eukprot:COSAG02_NODE_1054_length_14930_cov_2157.848291_13_plen_66_part_00
MAGEARVIRAPNYIELLERGRAAERADSIRSVSEVEEVVCVCEGNRGYSVKVASQGSCAAVSERA